MIAFSIKAAPKPVHAATPLRSVKAKANFHSALDCIALTEKMHLLRQDGPDNSGARPNLGSQHMSDALKVLSS